MLKTNKDRLIIQEVLGRISHPLGSGSPSSTNYVTTWDGKPKFGIGSGGIKYNVKVGDSCFGWPEAEYLEPGVSLIGVEEGRGTAAGGRAAGPATGLYALSCVGNEVQVLGGDGKGAKGVVTGKAGYTGGQHVITHFADEDLLKLGIGDQIRVRAEGVGLKIEGFDGALFSMAPSFLESLGLELANGELVVPVALEVPAYAMGSGSGGSPGLTGHMCIQSNPPELVKELGLEGLRMGDLVACRDILMHYGKGYYRGAVTVGVVAFGASDQAGHGPGVFAIASSKKGKIRPRLDPEANVAKFLGLKR